jgi:N-terminal CTNNB1 binding
VCSVLNRVESGERAAKWITTLARPPNESKQLQNIRSSKMPHVNGSDGDDLGDADEIKVFKHDEECEEEKKLIAEERQSDSLTEDKSSLVTEGESQVIKLKTIIFVNRTMQT